MGTDVKLQVLTGSGLNSMGAGSLQLQMLPYPSTLLQKIFLRRFSSVSAQWHSASVGRISTFTISKGDHPNIRSGAAADLQRR